VPYYWAGMKMYDLVAYASGSGLGLSRFVSAGEAKRLFPTLAHKQASGETLKGTVRPFPPPPPFLSAALRAWAWWWAHTEVGFDRARAGWACTLS
jgi:hypothetical protein